MIRVSNIRLLDGTPLEVNTQAELDAAMWNPDVIMDMQYVPDGLEDHTEPRPGHADGGEGIPQSHSSLSMDTHHNACVPTSPPQGYDH
jgi:hypothetical protein